MTSRAEGRVLFLGIRHNRDVIAFVCNSDHNVAISMEESLSFNGVFEEFALVRSNSGKLPLEQLISDIKQIHNTGWIDGQRLNNKEKSFLVMLKTQLV